jgi:hypothetical protein
MQRGTTSLIAERQHARVRPRGLVSNKAILVINLHTPHLVCDLIELSAGGACVFVRGDSEIPYRVTFIHSGTKKECRVVWRKGRRIGLRYA